MALGEATLITFPSTLDTFQYLCTTFQQEINICFLLRMSSPSPVFPQQQNAMGSSHAFIYTRGNADEELGKGDLIFYKDAQRKGIESMAALSNFQKVSDTSNH